MQDCNAQHSAGWPTGAWVNDMPIAHAVVIEELIGGSAGSDGKVVKNEFTKSNSRLLGVLDRDPPTGPRIDIVSVARSEDTALTSVDQKILDASVT